MLDGQPLIAQRLPHALVKIKHHASFLEKAKKQVHWVNSGKVAQRRGFMIRFVKAKP